MKERFEEIYQKNEWSYGSGHGSLLINNEGYIEFLEKFMEKNNILSVLDLGCGDWQFSKKIDWTGIQYKGYDIVESVVNNNNKRYSSNNISFHVFSDNFSKLPEVDLLIVKDVLQHWSKETIDNFIPSLNRYKFSLITNCVGFDETLNDLVEDGGFSNLDLRLPPYNINLEEVYKYTNKKPWFLPKLFFKPTWIKKVLLMRGKGSD